jgi:hypothetical protein
MEKFFQRFVSDDAGNITADWVVLVAGVIMLCGAVFGSLSTGTTDVASDTAEYIETYDPFI